MRRDQVLGDSMQPTSQTRSWVLLGGNRYYGGTNLLSQSRRHRAACWSAPYNRGTRYRLRRTGAVTVPAAASPAMTPHPIEARLACAHCRAGNWHGIGELLAHWSLSHHADI